MSIQRRRIKKQAPFIYRPKNYYKTLPDREPEPIRYNWYIVRFGLYDFRNGCFLPTQNYVWSGCYTFRRREEAVKFKNKVYKEHSDLANYAVHLIGRM